MINLKKPVFLCFSLPFFPYYDALLIVRAVANHQTIGINEIIYFNLYEQESRFILTKRRKMGGKYKRN